MAIKAKAKPKAKAGKATAAKKSPAKKAPKAAAKAQKPEAMLEAGAFVEFTGYRSEMADDEVVFADGDTLKILEIDTDNADGVLYTCIKASDIEEFEENGDENVEGGQVAPSEIKSLKGRALELVREQFIPVHMIGKLSDMMDEHESATDVAIELNQAINENYFYLGGALARVLQTGEYLTENGGGYEGEDAFHEFCQNEFGFKASKGRQLARIYQTFSELPDFDAERLSTIGWSKANMIERFVTEDNVDDILETAENTTQRELTGVLKEQFVAADGKTASGKAAGRGGDKLVTKTLNFRLTEDSAESVEIALQQCMKQSGIASLDLALERICVEWAQDHVQTKSAAKSIKTKANKAAKAREAASAGKAPAKAEAATAPKKAGRKKAA